MEPRVCDTVGNVKVDVAADTAPPDGRRSRWTAHRAARRDELIDAAVRAIKHHGARVGMDQIAADARTSKPVIYRYFADKTDLHRAVTQRVVGTILAALRSVTGQAPSARDLIRESVAAYLALLEQSPELYRFVVAHPHLEAVDGAEPATFSEVIADMLAEQLAASMRAGGLDPTYAHPWGEAIVGFISSASLWWLDHPSAMSREQLADYLSALLWGGAAGVQSIAGRPADPRPAPGVFPLLEDR
jgi:AcrR family transcriptional regulator